MFWEQSKQASRLQPPLEVLVELEQWAHEKGSVDVLPERQEGPVLVPCRRVLIGNAM